MYVRKLLVIIFTWVVKSTLWITPLLQLEKLRLESFAQTFIVCRKPVPPPVTWTDLNWVTLLQRPPWTSADVGTGSLCSVQLSPLALQQILMSCQFLTN